MATEKNISNIPITLIGKSLNEILSSLSGPDLNIVIYNSKLANRNMEIPLVEHANSAGIEHAPPNGKKHLDTIFESDGQLFIACPDPAADPVGTPIRLTSKRIIF